MSKELTEKDEKLINYLAKHNHWTPFAHPQVQFHIKAPIFVRTQLFKHKVGMVENEISRRYVDFEPDFYTPNYWRERPDKSIKQGSGDKEIEGKERVYDIYKQAVNLARDAYDVSIIEGLAPEIARGILPQCMYTEWYWTGSLASFARVALQRSENNAQEETQHYAFAIDDIMSELFPVAWRALV
jgi:thymidylate synthase (FAD)